MIRLVRADELRRKEIEPHDDEEADECTIDPVMVPVVAALTSGRANGLRTGLTNGKHSELTTSS